MKFRMYLHTFRDVVGITPDTSLHIKSSVKVALLSFPISYFLSRCFPSRKRLQTLREYLMRGNPTTISSLCNYKRYLKFIWLNLSCHIMLVSLSWVNTTLWNQYGKTCENSYALEAWFVAPLAIIFLVEISEISTVSC